MYRIEMNVKDRDEMVLHVNSFEETHSSPSIGNSMLMNFEFNRKIRSLL
jgi:hypothetical protein